MRLSQYSVITFPIVILSMLALLTAWINTMVQAPIAKRDGSSRHDPDYTMNDFVTSQTDINGDLHYKLAASHMEHFPDNNTTKLQNPRYTQFIMGKAHTEVQALHGDIASNGDEIKLFNHVKVTREARSGKGEMTLETEYLNIFPHQGLIRTDRPVIIKQAPKTLIYATGMVYEKDKKILNLLHQVRVHYEKPNKKPGALVTHTSLQLKPQSTQLITKKRL